VRHDLYSIHAAIEGSGIDIGKRPHMVSHLQARALVAPLGDASVARMRAYYAVVSDHTERDIADDFVSWLIEETKQGAGPRRAAVFRLSR
jgi:hypothetical protein